MPICEIEGCEDHFACRLRAKGLSYSSKATPTARVHKVLPRTPDPAWERGIVGEHRPDGSFMPYLAPDTRSPLRVHQHAGIRSDVAEQVTRLKTDPNVFRVERSTPEGST